MVAVEHLADLAARHAQAEQGDDGGAACGDDVAGATANGATATLEILPGSDPVVVNDAELTRRMLPALERAAGTGNVIEVPYATGAEDYAFFALEVPSVFIFVGSTSKGQDPAAAPSNHSPLYFVDESSLDVGLRALVEMALEYLEGAQATGT